MSKPKNVAIVSILILAILAIAICLIVQQLQENKNSVSNNNTNTNQVTTSKFKSTKGVTIKLDGIKSGDTIASPLTITGKVPGSWSFEATFPVVLTDWDGLIIATGSAVLTGDWMTDSYVPFTATLAFETSTTNKSGNLILQKSNASGLSENDDAVEIPIQFQ